MRILYGVQTTGHGHLVRSTPLIRGLRARGHSVDVLLSGPPPDPVWAERIGPPFTTHPGLTFSADGGRIRYVRTALQARPLRFVADVLRQPSAGRDLVVTDYEPITAWSARRHGLRSIGIGHLYAFAWPLVPRASGNLVTRAVLHHFAPAGVPVGLHWGSFGAPVLPPTVDPEIRALRRGPPAEDLVLVYLAFEPPERLVPLLKTVPSRRFHVYARTGAAVENGNVTVRPVSRAGFVEDLSRCTGVIANAGFTLTSECLHHGIPLLAMPIHGHLEQESNALALGQLGLATVTRTLTRDVIDCWLQQPPPPAQAYPDVTAALIDWIAAGAAEPLTALSQRLWTEAAAAGRAA